MSRRWGSAAFVVALVVTTGRDAHAHDWDFQFAAFVNGGWLRETPSMSADAVSLESRRIGEGALRSRGGVAMLGIGADTELTFDDRWKVPVLGLQGWFPVGRYDAVNTSFDGSVAQLKPWTASRIRNQPSMPPRRWRGRWA